MQRIEKGSETYGRTKDAMYTLDMNERLLHDFVSQLVRVILLRIHSLPEGGRSRVAAGWGCSHVILLASPARHAKPPHACSPAVPGHAHTRVRDGGGIWGDPLVVAMPHAVLERSALHLAQFTHEQDRDGSLPRPPGISRMRTAGGGSAGRLGQKMSPASSALLRCCAIWWATLTWCGRPPRDAPARG